MNGIKKLWKWSKKYLWLVILIVALSTILQWLYAYLPLFIQYAFERINQVTEQKTDLPRFLLNWYNNIDDMLTCLLMVGISMIALQAVHSVLRFLDNYYEGALAHYIGYDLRIKIYDHVMSLSYTYHNHSDIGDLIQRSTSDVDQTSTFISSMIPGLIDIFVTVIIGAYRVYQISPTLMWVSMVSMPITAASSIIYFKYCNKAFQRIEESESKMTTIIQENVNSARVVRAFANEEYEFEKMDEANQVYTKKNGKFNTVMAMFWGCSDFLVFLQYALTMSVSIFLARDGLLSSADIVAALLLMGMLIWPMRSLGRIIASFGKASVAANRIDEVLRIPEEYEINGEKMPQITGDIEFKNVTFKFEDDSKPLLNNVSFHIRPGQTIAIVGKTGSGKSTICNILTRMLEINEGEILIDGVSIKDIEKKHLRRNLKFVLQDPFLFSKTVYENVAITDTRIPTERIYDAARTAAIHTEIEKFERGYKTIVGEKGTTLSGGQKQRIAIARMLVKDSNVIIFDDSLSALDTKTDLMIRIALKKKSKDQTMIIITHRSTTAKEADQIIVLDQGSVSQIGKHEELVVQEGLYKELWGIQGELEEEFNAILKEGN
ncbi:MAG: ABC transporter ATP-binding protein/permease [Roseburia sp.]|nr:ABC transporter ATP-binding protein/permease [Anaeroplasma bactoclasticum]MCM1196192.1 ABC transporter ATP-binding protein/permease [Roseburia sp.]MCM1557272.1 ABC transporter ATP-binding protein/permease [Anaeroplasma bactoclasticum]